MHAKCLRSLPVVRDYFRNYRAKKRSVSNSARLLVSLSFVFACDACESRPSLLWLASAIWNGLCCSFVLRMRARCTCLLCGMKPSAALQRTRFLLKADAALRP